MSEIRTQEIIETIGTDAIADTVFDVLTSSSAAAGIVRLERPEMPPEEEWLKFYCAKTELGIKPNGIRRLWEYENQPRLETIIPLTDIQASVQAAWHQLKLQGNIQEITSVGTTEEAKIPHYDFPGIALNNKGNPVCRVAVLSFNNEIPAEIRAVRGPSTASPDKDILQLHQDTEATALEQLNDPIDFCDLPEGKIVGPYDLAVIPSLPYGALHAVLASGPGRNTRLYDISVEQQI